VNVNQWEFISSRSLIDSNISSSLQKIGHQTNDNVVIAYEIYAHRKLL
jgi:hypothetical protein